MVLAIVAYFGGIFTPLYAQYRAEQIQAGRTRKAMVRLSPESPATAPRESHIIGTTSQFVFLYDAPTRKTRIIPFDNVAEISFTNKVGQRKVRQLPR
ncbi:MAG: hypothetical protein H7145_05015 [Akkermansiaceae bacterium]|nr:hypothetical protein [Armatimonadota bacterium]